MKSLITKIALSFVLIAPATLAIPATVSANAPDVKVIVTTGGSDPMDGAVVTWYSPCADGRTKSATATSPNYYYYPTNGNTYYGSEADFPGVNGGCDQPVTGGFNCNANPVSFSAYLPGYTCPNTGPMPIQNNANLIEIVGCSKTPPPPSAATLTATSTCSAAAQPQVSLSWTGTADVFKVYKNSSTLYPNTTSPQTDTSVTVGTSYAYHVESWNSGNNTPAESNTVNVTVNSCDSTPPTATLTNFASQCYQPVGGTTLPSTVTGVFSDNVGATSAWYTIQRNPTGNGLCLDNADSKFDTSCTNIVTNTVAGTNTTAQIQPRTFSPTPNNVSVSYSAGPISPSWFPSPQPSPNGDKYLIKLYAQDAASNIGHDAGTTFTVDDACLAPFLQTTQGDVHSNTQINTPGGP